MPDEDLLEIAKQIDFDLAASIEKATAFERKEQTQDEIKETNFSLEFSGSNITNIFKRHIRRW